MAFFSGVGNHASKYQHDDSIYRSSIALRGKNKRKQTTYIVFNTQQ